MSRTIRNHGEGCGMPWREMYAPTALEKDMDFMDDGVDVVYDRSWKHWGNSMETISDPKAKRLLKKLASKARRKVWKGKVSTYVVDEWRANCIVWSNSRTNYGLAPFGYENNWGDSFKELLTDTDTFAEVSGREYYPFHVFPWEEDYWYYGEKCAEEVEYTLNNGVDEKMFVNSLAEKLAGVL